MSTNIVIPTTTDIFINNSQPQHQQQQQQLQEQHQQDYIPKRSNSRQSSSNSTYHNNYIKNFENKEIITNNSNNNSVPRVVNDNMSQQYQQQLHQQQQLQQSQQQQAYQQQHQQQSQIPTSTSSSTISTMATGSNSKRVHREVRFGSYILGSTLGEGEFGKVKLGWRKDGKIPSQVAIKLIKRSTIIKDSDSEIKIHREINSLKLLNHPNIVNLVEVMKSGKYVGIVLEYASGGELFDYILQHKYLKESIAKKLFAQLVSGVDYMHSKGLIHRDLKLENLLLDKHKNVIISDFGFVNSYNKDRNDLMKTSCGSPCYAAPELVLTQSPYEGRKVDIWSLGVILYAMLSGYLPFDDDPENEDGSDIIKLYHYICKTPLTFPEFVSPLARDLLRKIIVSDPKRRINIEEIRQHPFLSSYSQLLSIRQPEWDKIYKDKQKPSIVYNEPQIPTYNKRYSMVNIPTNSSNLIGSSMHHQYSQINQIHQSPQLQQQQQPQQQSQPQPISSHSRSYSSTSISLLYASPSMSNGTNHQISDSTDSLALSKTPSPKKPSSVSVSPTRGHQKSASISNSNSTSASYALKAVVNDDLLSSRPNILTTNNNNYTSASTISTIVESPTKQEYIFNQQQQKTPILLPPKEFSKLPPSTKKPRPTSYHPSSMSSNMSIPLTYKEIIKLPNNSTNSVTQYISTSPPKEIFNATSSGNNGNINNQQQHSRRNSVVTHINVNGVLSKENHHHHPLQNDSPDYNKRNSAVLSYLEDKIDVLDLNESHPQIKENKVEKLDESNAGEVNDTDLKHNEKEDDDKDKENEELPPPIEEYIETLPKHSIQDSKESLPEIIKPEPKFSKQQKEQQQPPRLVSSTSTSTSSSITTNPKQQSKINKRHSIISRKSIQTNRSYDENKENKEQKEQVKKNRFSILSFSSSTNNNNNSNISTKSRKALEPSNDSNISKSSITSKRHSIIGSNSQNSTRGNNNNSNEIKESSTAKKVIDFFKRRSIYNVV
ncbi:uncharacterized protein KGF55_000148 [Candida pseudojiufengensis]|uniref:uncharacterized protein n=1 Tax=Candida pseudojiufengensis TaxID=497109 RepID=UPI00222592B8|nr:uncharacterized protein KGF55_000148 [Candida pseudojiufengensis]KAI5966739.1 hypothetical protein KGF55_000148 [Candida pseudojiufengensis]